MQLYIHKCELRGGKQRDLLLVTRDKDWKNNQVLSHNISTPILIFIYCVVSLESMKSLLPNQGLNPGPPACQAFIVIEQQAQSNVWKNRFIFLYSKMYFTKVFFCYLFYYNVLTFHGNAFFCSARTMLVIYARHQTNAETTFIVLQYTRLGRY